MACSLKDLYIKMADLQKFSFVFVSSKLCVIALESFSKYSMQCPTHIGAILSLVSVYLCYEKAEKLVTITYLPYKVSGKSLFSLQLATDHRYIWYETIPWTLGNLAVALSYSSEGLGLSKSQKIKPAKKMAQWF